MKGILGWLDFFDRLALVGVGVAVVAWLLFKLEIWSDYFNRFFLFTGDLLSYAYLFIGLLIIKKVLEWLLKLHVRMTFRR